MTVNKNIYHSFPHDIPISLNNTKTFFGVPISQTHSVKDDDSFKNILIELTEIGSIETVLNLDLTKFLEPLDSSEEDNKLITLFIEWIRENQKELINLKFKFLQNYHGSDEPPAIFGVYGGINLPNVGAEKIDTSVFSKIIEKETRVKNLFSTLPQPLIDRFPPFRQAGFWSNDHSS